jgi:hypothetical protein
VLAEKRALAACRDPARPEWLKTARYASRREDRQGVDIVLESDIGRLQLQVKSSEHGKERFLAERRRLRIAVVVVRPYEPDETVRANVYAAITALREHYLGERPAIWRHLYVRP